MNAIKTIKSKCNLKKMIWNEMKNGNENVISNSKS